MEVIVVVFECHVDSVLVVGALQSLVWRRSNIVLQCQVSKLISIIDRALMSGLSDILPGDLGLLHPRFVSCLIDLLILRLLFHDEQLKVLIFLVEDPFALERGRPEFTALVV